MNLCGTFTRALLGIAILAAVAAPSSADPTPTPEVSPTASPLATTSAASPVPSPAPSGSYKEELKAAALATSLLLQAQSGDVDRSMLEAKMNLALSPSLVQSVSSQLAPLGKPKSVTLVSRSVHGDYVAYRFRIAWDDVAADESFALDLDGKIVAWSFRPVS